MEIPGLEVGNRPSLSNIKSLLSSSPLYSKRGSKIYIRLYSNSNRTRVVVEGGTNKKATAIEETSRKRYYYRSSRE